MNRREALSALMALPATATVKAATLAPNTVIVIECDDLLSQEAMNRIKEHLSGVWPGHKVLVLCRGMSLKLVQG